MAETSNTISSCKGVCHGWVGINNKSCEAKITINLTRQEYVLAETAKFKCNVPFLDIQEGYLLHSCLSSCQLPSDPLPAFLTCLSSLNEGNQYKSAIQGNAYLGLDFIISKGGQLKWRK